MPAGRKKTHRIILILLTGFVIIGYLLIRTFHPVLETAVNRELKALIRSDPQRLYDLTYDSIRINISKGNISVTNLRVIPRKEIVDSLFLLGGLNKYTAEVHLGRLEMVDFRWIKFLRTGMIHVHTFRISDLMVRYFLNQNVPQLKRTSIGNDLLNQKFISAETEHIDLLNGSLDFFIVREDTAQVLSFDSLDIRFTEFYTDSALIKKPIGYRLRELDLSLRNLTNDLVKDYRVTCGEISFNSRENRFSLKKIQMTPSREKMDSRNWLKLEVKALEAAGINYDSLLYSGSVIMDQVFVDEPHFTYVRPVERLQKDTIRFLPRVTFRNLPIPMAIDTIQIRCGQFNYLKHGQMEPTITLNASDINVTGLSFSSDPVVLQKNPTFFVTGSTRFLEEAKLTMNFRFPLTDPHNAFEIKGRMDTLDAKLLNPVIKNSKNMEIVHGVINSLVFEIYGNDTLSTGTLNLDYNDLKLAALKVNEADFRDSHRKGFLTGIINLVVNSKNDTNKSSFSEGIIYLERDASATFLDYSLESLMTGVLTSMVPESKMFIKPEKTKNP